MVQNNEKVYLEYLFKMWLNIVLLQNHFIYQLVLFFSFVFQSVAVVSVGRKKSKYRRPSWSQWIRSLALKPKILDLGVNLKGLFEYALELMNPFLFCLLSKCLQVSKEVQMKIKTSLKNLACKQTFPSRIVNFYGVLLAKRSYSCWRKRYIV